jgi:hypothetical protein
LEARTARERIQDLQLELLEHQPHSPDLAPSDFRLLHPLKRRLDGKRFADKEGETGEEVTETTVKKTSMLRVSSDW